MLLSHMLPLLPKRIYCGITGVKLKDERGLGTIEMVILMAVLIGVAFAFRGVITELFEGAKKSINKHDFENI